MNSSSEGSSLDSSLDSSPAAEESESSSEAPLSKAPSFNGKTVFPLKVFMNGLKGHQVAAVYAILNKNYKRGYVQYAVYLLHYFHVYEILSFVHHVFFVCL